MPQTDGTATQVCIVLLLALLGSGLLLAAGTAVAQEERPPSEGANFTVAPVDNDDRPPGIDGAEYFLSSVGADAWGDSDGLQRIDFYMIRTGAADFSACNPDDIAALGIDRGGNLSGAKYDEDLVEHMKNYDIDEERVTIEIYDEEDLGGESTYLNAADQTIAKSYGCVSNPDDAGWYQFVGYVNGTNYDGEYDEVTLYSHYFWICDCANESEARERLGPPPHEDDGDGGDGDSTPTPTPTETDGGGDSTQTATPTPTPTAGGSAETQTPTETPDDTGGDATSTPTPTAGGPAGGDDATPTPGDGAGFGAAVALASLAAAVLLGRRRR